MYHNLRQINIRYLAWMLLAVLMLFNNGYAVKASESEGLCGTDLSWTLDEAGTLTILGSGNMNDFPEQEMAPWYESRKEILRVVLPDGLTNIGNLAFYECENLTAIVIPDSVEIIGEYAFAGCKELVILRLGSKVQKIQEGAFLECLSLADVSFPDSLQMLGIKAFYRCETLTTITIPSSVTSLGTSVFSYCINLISADIQANIEVLPEWNFYGCSKLTTIILPDNISDINEHAFRGCDQLCTVYYNGEAKSKQEIEQLVSNDVPKFGDVGVVSGGKPNGVVISGTANEEANGTLTQQSTQVEKGENSSVSVTIENNGSKDDGTNGDFDASINVIVNGNEGWKEAQDVVESALKEINDSYSGIVDGGITDVLINVYVKDTNSINQEFIDSLVGRDVYIAIYTQNGSVWKMDGEELDLSQMSGNYNLSYELTVGESELCEKLGASKVFVVQFDASAEVNTEVLIRIPEKYAMQHATLFQRNGNGFDRFSTVVVDKSGYAHFYLASVSSDVEYYVALDVGVLDGEIEGAIVPDTLVDSYGKPIRLEPIQYEITGRKSSWGMNINQVTWILVAVMILSITVVGITMYILNQRKQILKYTPDIKE